MSISLECPIFLCPPSVPILHVVLRVEYINADDDPHTVRHDVQRLLALPFVPLPDLEQAFDAVMDEVDDRVLAVATHLETRNLRGQRPLRRRRAVPPMFPPNLWNVHDQAVQNKARTTNVVEGWHSKFQKLLVVHHANVRKFLDEVISLSTVILMSP